MGSSSATSSPSVTGTLDLSTLSRESPVEGRLILNGASFRVRAESADDVVKVVNRHTPQSAVTASLTDGSTDGVAKSKPVATTASSSVPGPQYLVLTSADDPLVVNAEPVGLFGVEVGMFRSPPPPPKEVPAVTSASTTAGFFAGFKPAPVVPPPPAPAVALSSL